MTLQSINFSSTIKNGNTKIFKFSKRVKGGMHGLHGTVEFSKGGRYRIVKDINGNGIFDRKDAVVMTRKVKAGEKRMFASALTVRNDYLVVAESTANTPNLFKFNANLKSLFEPPVTTNTTTTVEVLGPSTIQYVDRPVEVYVDRPVTNTVYVDKPCRESTPDVLNTSENGNELFIYNLSSSASYTNQVGFYRLEDSQGGVKDTVTGKTIQPGETGYEKAVMARSQVNGDGVLFDMNTSTPLVTSVKANSNYAPFIFVKDTGKVFTEFNYSDGFDHIQSTGNKFNRQFNFEDFTGGGDKDFDDFKFNVNVRTKQTV